MIGAIIQARMSSDRLPGKVMKQVAGQPLLFYLVTRLRQSKRIQTIILATSVEYADDPIVTWAISNGITTYRGSLNDVLDRYYCVAKIYGLKHVVRITGDCPLVDPEICDRLIELYLNSSADYARLSTKFAEGLDCEVISFDALEASHQNAKVMSEREHVTLYARNQPKKFRSVTLDNIADDSRYRITVDNEEDFEVVSTIMNDFLNHAGNLTISWPAIRKYADNNPDLMKRNVHIERNEGLKKSLLADCNRNSNLKDSI